MTSDIPTELRQLVAERAANCCEYCLMPQVAVLHKHEPDHIIPTQHGGETDEQNLALSCMRCNRYKGPNVGSFDPITGALVPFFNPRKESWIDHFTLENGMIIPQPAQARVTIKIFRINDEIRIEERIKLVEAGLYPI